MTVDEFKKLCEAAIKINPELKESVDKLEIIEVGLRIATDKHPKIRDLKYLIQEADWVLEGKLPDLDMSKKTFSAMRLRSLYRTVMTIGQELFKLQQIKESVKW